MSAQLHLRILSLFGQLCRLNDGDNVLARFALSIFSSSSSSSKSWFWKVRKICLQYDLPHPVSWLSSRFSKERVKALCRPAVIQYWLSKLRQEASLLPSLKYVRVDFLSLSKCHPMFRLCSSSTWEVEKATWQGRLCSGRYKLESLTKHWQPWNLDGMCSLLGCWKTTHAHKGNIENFISSCHSLSDVRGSLLAAIEAFVSPNPSLAQIVQHCILSDPTQFFLDCSIMPVVISGVQTYGEDLLCTFFKITSNFFFSSP